MNIANAIVLRDYVANEIPDREFLYKHVFSDLITHESLAPVLLPEPHCQTAACLLGHAQMLWGRGYEGSGYCDWSQAVEERLQLSHEQGEFLFFVNVSFAGRQDALRRLTHLIDGKAIADYDWTSEPDVNTGAAPLLRRF